MIRLSLIVCSSVLMLVALGNADTANTTTANTEMNSSTANTTGMNSNDTEINSNDTEMNLNTTEMSENTTEMGDNTTTAEETTTEATTATTTATTTTTTTTTTPTTETTTLTTTTVETPPPFPTRPDEEHPRAYILTFVGMYSSDSTQVSISLRWYLGTIMRLNGGGFPKERLVVENKNDFTYVNVTVWSNDTVERKEPPRVAPAGPSVVTGGIVMPTPARQHKRNMAAAQAQGDNSTEAILQQYVHTVDYMKLYQDGHMYDVALSLLRYPTDKSMNPSYQKTLIGTPLEGIVAMGRLTVAFDDAHGAPFPPSGGENGPDSGDFFDDAGDHGGNSPLPMPMPLASGTVCSMDLTDDTLTKLNICNNTQAMLIPYATGGNGPIYISNLTFTDKPEQVISSPYNRKTHCTHMMDAGVICGRDLRKPEAADYYNESHCIACRFTGNQEDAPMALSKLLNVPKEQIIVFKHDEELYIDFNASSSLTPDDVYLIWQLTSDWAKLSIANVTECMKKIKPSTTAPTTTATDTSTSTDTTTQTTSSSTSTSTSTSTTMPPPPLTTAAGNNTNTNNDLVTTQVRFSAKEGKAVDKEELKKLLAKKLGAKEEDIVTKGESDGSVVFEFSTAALARQARDMANRGDLEAANVNSAAGEPLPEEDSGGSNTVIIVLAVIGGIILFIIIAVIIYKVCSGDGSGKNGGFEEEKSENTEMLLAPTTSGDTEMAEKPSADPPQNDEQHLPVKDDDL